MIRPPKTLTIHSLLILSGTFLAMFPVHSSVALDTTPEAQVRRPDPISGALLPVAADQVKPGKIYNHFSQRHGRYVWAYALEGGSFSYPLGIGSTELPANFDVASSALQTQELLEAEAGPWARKSRLEGKQIMVRLGANGKWSILQNRSIRAHYDLNTGQRWEWHGKRRVAVLNMYGRIWGLDGENYVTARPAQVHCN